MTEIEFHRDGWIEAALGDAVEDQTFTRLTVRVGETLVTRNFSRRGGGESDAINVPLYPLARAIAESWWPLLYEPIRSRVREGFRAKHRLDTAMHGYVFPALALCSGGDDSILADWLLSPLDIAPIEFLTPPPSEPVLLERSQAESALMDLVETVLARLRHGSNSHAELQAAWDRVTNSMNDSEELAYCLVAGRLGIDPYDPEGPDLTTWIKGLSPELVNDIGEAAELAEISPLTDWIREVQGDLANAPEIEVAAFGNPIPDDLSRPAWATGYRAAEELRVRIGLDRSRPRRAVEQLLDGAVQVHRALRERAPSSINGLISRRGSSARVGTVARSARQQRFRACAATYIAWYSRPEENRAATVALTRLQQASKAFAAELMAPKDLLRERAGQFGLTADTIDEAASDFVCPHDAVVLQAFNHGIAMRGVEVPAYRRPSLA